MKEKDPRVIGNILFAILILLLWLWMLSQVDYNTRGADFVYAPSSPTPCIESCVTPVN